LRRFERKGSKQAKASMVKGEMVDVVKDELQIPDYVA
jgi:hypothetical protein